MQSDGTDQQLFSQVTHLPLNIVALAGGVGGAKLIDGLARVLPPGALTIIGNIGDDLRRYGLAISPDLDTVMYTLANLVNPVFGWGLADDTRQMIGMMQRYGDEGWFGLGDRDLATHLLRTEMLTHGKTLGEVTAYLTKALGIASHLIPMSNQRVATMVETIDTVETTGTTDATAGTTYSRILEFQEYFVRYRWQPVVKRIWYEGAVEAQPAPGVIDAIEKANAIIICPSNPILSIEPILQVREIRAAIQRRSAPCVVVSPVIAGTAVKGPTVKLMAELGMDTSVSGIAAYYDTLIDGIVLDTQDREANIDETRIVKHVAEILMNSVDDRVRLANDVLNWVNTLRTLPHRT